MANTNKGYYYPGQNEYGDSEADVLFHMKKMAESMDDVLEREEEQRGEEKENLQEQISQNAEDISEIEAEQIIQNNKINKNKTDIEALQQEQETQDANIQEAQEDIATLKAENAELKDDLEDAEDNQLTAPASGESIDLSNSANAKIRNPKFTGKSWQEGEPTPESQQQIHRTGDNVNLMPFENQDFTVKGVRFYIEKGTLYLDGTSIGEILTNITEFKNNFAFTLKKGTYNFSRQDDNSTPITVVLKKYDDDSNIISLVNATNINKSFTLNEDTKVYLGLYIYNKTFNEEQFSLKLEKGTKLTPWSPYGCGNINEKVQNFNIWDEEWELGLINPTTGETQTSSTVIRSKNFIPVKPSTDYYFKNGTDRFWVYGYDINKNYIGYAFGSNSSVANVARTTLSNCYYLKFQCRSEYGTTYNNDICINVSDTAKNGTYIPHAEQNISFPLEEGQIVTQNDYIDDDGIHHVKWSEVLDGVNKKIDLFQKYNDVYFAGYSVEKKTVPSTNVIKPLCTHFQGIKNGTVTPGYCYTVASGTRMVLVPTDQTITTVQAFNEWLQEQYNNGTPVEIEYDLAEEYVEPFTEEQAEAWKLIKKAKTYKNVTHISSEDETPATMDFVYVRDLQTYLDNRFNELSSAIVAQGGV